MNQSKESGFNRIDLLATMAMIGILAMALLPALAKSGISTKALQCLNNQRQMVNAWRMYADDNQDRLVFASTDGMASNPNNQYAWAGVALDYNSANRANWDIMYDLVKRPLWRYSGSNAAIYRCPADESFLVVNGVARTRIRSMAMNLYLGGFAGTSGGWAFIDNYRIYFKSTEFSVVAGPPGKVFVFTDIRPDAIGYGNFLADMTGYSPLNPASYSLLDYPGYAHDGGGTFSFVDGHCEPKQWLDVRTTPPPFSIITSTSSPNNPDVAWLQDHSTRKK